MVTTTDGVSGDDGRPARSTDRILVLHPVLRDARTADRLPEAALDEAVGLAAAIDRTVVGAELVRVDRPQPATLIGSGAVADIGDRAEAAGAGLIFVDHALSPIQQRNLERAWNAKVIDRTGLILEIFGARARTREGQLQVELAALTYQRSRLVRSWTHLERQRGGFGFLGGPGESQLEMDRRLIGDRIVKLKRELEEVRRTRALHRKARAKVPYPVVALVGYTNAGKSTLFNRLAGADVFARDLLFATLDPTMRAIALPSGRKIILSDTVGFISDLPTHLVAAFRATLEEVSSADIILHVRDISHPDTEAQRRDVETILKDLGIDVAEDERVVEVLNKIDRLEPAERAGWRVQADRAQPERNRRVAVSAVTGEGLDALTALLDHFMTRHRRTVDFRLRPDDGAAIAWLYANGEVVGREDADDRITLQVAIEAADLRRFEKRYGALAAE